MPLLAAYIVPHPPLAVSEVGRGRERDIASTLEGFELVASRIASIAPKRLIVISPHTAYYADCIFLAGGKGASGDLSRFGAPDVKISLGYDDCLRRAIVELASANGIPTAVMPPEGSANEDGPSLDHGMIVPLSFIDERYPSANYMAISIGGSALPRQTLVEFGKCLAMACDESGEDCVLLVSGDLSHKLKEDGPYGLDPSGPVFEAAFEEVVSSGDPMGFARLDERMCEEAAECGLSGFVMMAGALERAAEDSGIPFASCLISHEGPFGVGYGVAAFEREDVRGDVGSNPDLSQLGEGDALVRLAIETIRDHVTKGTVPPAPELPDGEPARSGCFVSIHTASTGALRGCIGTIVATQDSLAEEIIANAVSASSRDPRFPAISESELDDLEVNVDVLLPAEAATMDDLDPQEFGIIVTQGWKRGLLLPDLEGVDTVEQQFRIACAKAGIDPNSDPSTIEIERFKVIRHE